MPDIHSKNRAQHMSPHIPVQDVLPAHEREALLAARHRPNAALQVMSQLILAASLRETQVCLLSCVAEHCP